MAGTQQLGVKYPLAFAAGDDFTLTLTATESAAAYVWGTVEAVIVGHATITAFTVSLPVDGTAILSLTDAQTTTLGVGGYAWFLRATKAGYSQTWMSGTLTVNTPGTPGTSAVSATVTVTTGAATSITVTSSIYDATARTSIADHLADTTDAHDASAASVLDAGGYYTGTNVETVLAELPSLFVRTGGTVSLSGSPTYPYIEVANGSDKATVHATIASGFAGPYIIGVGTDNPGLGILVNNKVNGGLGYKLVQYAAITDTASYGFWGVQGSATSPLMFLEQSSSAGAAPVLQLTQNGTATSGQKLAAFTSATAGAVGWGYDIGRIYADTGRFDWMDELRANGGKVVALETDTSLSGAFSQVALAASSSEAHITFSRNTGGGSHYPFRIRTSTQMLEFARGAASAIDSESFTTTYLAMGWDGSKNTVNVSTTDLELLTASKGVILRSANNTRYKVTVSDAGALVVAAA